MTDADRNHGQELAPEQALELLRESEQRYREIFETNPAIKIVVDPETGQIVDANAAACAFYGYDRPTLCSMRIQQINTLPAERVNQELERAKQEKRLFFNFKHQLASGEIRDVEVYTGPVTIGSRQLLHSIIVDVSERVRLRDQLLQAQRMEAVGRMAGGVAHDFNNLLTVVLTCVELAKTSLPASHPASSAIAEIEQAALRGADLTQQLLALARKRLVEPELVDLSVVVTRMGGILQRLVGEHVDLTLTCERSPWTVEVDPTQIEQVLVNLVVNARDAMPRGGTVEVTTKNVEVASEHPGEEGPSRWVVLSVRDTGVGMTAEVRQRIFEPFFTTKPPSQGTGLGLSTVFGIVQQAGGFVRVESEPGSGSVFHVHLPAVDREVGERPHRKTLGGDSSGEGVILIAEDDETIRRLLTGAVASAGFTVLTASHGEHALEVYLAHGGPVDLLITDVVMPRMSGPELARALREKQPDLPVVFMSGYPSDLGDEPAALGARYLAKPFTTQALLSLVRQSIRPAPRRQG